MLELNVAVVRLLPPRPLPPRPLPPPPRSLVCKNCSTSITTENAVRTNVSSRAFKGFSGRATLFNSVSNATLAPPRVQLMATGVHTMQEITCGKCASYLGWKIIQARNRSEKWKEGSCLLELECLAEENPDSTPTPAPA